MTLIYTIIKHPTQKCLIAITSVSRGLFIILVCRVFYLGVLVLGKCKICLILQTYLKSLIINHSPCSSNHITSYIHSLHNIWQNNIYFHFLLIQILHCSFEVIVKVVCVLIWMIMPTAICIQLHSMLFSNYNKIPFTLNLFCKTMNWQISLIIVDK